MFYVKKTKTLLLQERLILFLNNHEEKHTIYNRFTLYYFLSLVKVKAEVLAPGSLKIKTEASAAASSSIIENMSTPPALENEGGNR